MNTKEWAEKLNGREYREEITGAEEKQAKEDGVVIVFGASDDLMEFRGAIDEELGANDGGTAYVSSKGLFDPERECAAGGIDNISYCPYLLNKQHACIKIRAEWEPVLMDGASWFIECPESLPHEHFDIMEDGELYCRGLVFRLADVPPVIPSGMVDTLKWLYDAAWNCATVADIDGRSRIVEEALKRLGYPGVVLP